MTRFITIKKFAMQSGYSEAAIRTKVNRGVWLQDQVWVRAPDDRILIDVDGYERWATGPKAIRSIPKGGGSVPPQSKDGR